MENITSPAELKHAIQLMETKQSILAIQLRDQFFITYESLKPVYLIENTINGIRSSPYLTNNIIYAAVGITAGYISRKAVVRESDSNLLILFGTVLQLVITKLVAQLPDNIKAFGKFIFQLIPRKKETN